MAAQSDQSPPGSGDDDKQTLTGSLNRGLNPMNFPDYYRQYRSEDPDDPGAKKIRDPDVWDDPDPSLRERVTPDTVSQWVFVAAGALVVLGLGVYLYPVFAPAYQSPYALGAFVLLAAGLVVYTKGRQDGMEAYKELDKWVVYYGNSIEVRPGEHVGSTGNWELFETIRNVSYGGFNARKLLKRDLPFAPSRLRDNANDSGDDAAVDALNPTTEVADCDHLGTFLFTHAGDLDYADGMSRADRQATHPRMLDQDAFDEFLRLLNELEHEHQRLQDEVEMLREHAESATDLRDELQAPRLEQSIRLLQELKSVAETRRRRSRADDDAAPTIGAGVNGEGFEQLDLGGDSE